MKYPVEHYDLWFVHLLHDRLDPETSKAWELKRESERPKIQDMLKFLDSQAKAISGVHFFGPQNAESLGRQGANHNDGVNENWERKTNSNESSEKNSSEPKRCQVCDEPFHRLFRCAKFKEMSVPE